MRKMSAEDEITLGMLQAIDGNSHVSQRNLSERLGIALGLTNAYLRRCARKGLIKISQVPMRRYAYYLTAQGFAEKSRLAGEYLSVSLGFFRKARRECTALFTRLNRVRWHRIALIGAGDLAEVAVLSAGEAGVEIIAVVDASRAGQRCAGRPIVGDFADVADKADAFLITDVVESQHRFDEIVARLKALGVEKDRLLTLDLLQPRGDMAAMSRDS